MAAPVKPKGSLRATQQSRSSAIQWRPGLRHFPWIAGIAIFITVICIVSTVVVVTLSHGQQIQSWRYEPAVWLAAISSVANFALATALSQATSITWWRAALHGTTLRSLHQIWRFGRGDYLVPRKMALEAYKIALVALVITATTIVNNPLLQRSTHVASGYETGEVEMQIYMMDDPLEKPYGIFQAGIPANTLIYTNFLLSIQRWYRKTPITTSGDPRYYCNGTCEGDVISPGLDVHCSTSTYRLNTTDPKNNGAPLFSVNFTRYPPSPLEAVLGLSVLYSKDVDEQCIATIESQHCNISTAMVHQPIRIENQTLSLNRDKSTKLMWTLTSVFDTTGQQTGDSAGPLALLEWLGYYYFRSSFTLGRQLPHALPETLGHGIVGIGEQYQVTNSKIGDTKCGYIYRQPTTDILDAMEEVLFRMAYNPDSTSLNYAMSKQTFSAHQVTPTLLFHSNYHYLYGGVAVLVTALLALLVQLWGWWELGQNVSLSPIEIAKAFGARLLRTASEGVNADRVVDELGHVRVQYGGVTFKDINPGFVRSSLEIWHEGLVRKPAKDELFGIRSAAIPGP